MSGRGIIPGPGLAFCFYNFVLHMLVDTVVKYSYCGMKLSACPIASNLNIYIMDILQQKNTTDYDLYRMTEILCQDEEEDLYRILCQRGCHTKVEGCTLYNHMIPPNVGMHPCDGRGGVRNSVRVYTPALGL